MKRKLELHKKIALVAHDNKKPELLEWALKNKEELKKHHLFGTGTTGKMIEEALDVAVTKFNSGPLGGDQQLGTAITEDRLDILIFFWDPMAAQPHDPDIRALLRLGVVWNIPMASNQSTADFIFSSPHMHAEYPIFLPDYSNYTARRLEHPQEKE